MSRTVIPETLQYRCDRCDAVAQDDRIEAWGGYGEIPGLVEVYPSPGGDEIRGSTAYDLCARCTKALHEFLDTPPGSKTAAETAADAEDGDHAYCPEHGTSQCTHKPLQVENGVDDPAEEASAGPARAP